MYGFGDVPNPANDAVGVLEDMLIEYLTDTVS
jgi:transcription initiation factor TFIID subunit 13